MFVKFFELDEQFGHQMDHQAIIKSKQWTDKQNRCYQVTEFSKNLLYLFGLFLRVDLYGGYQSGGKKYLDPKMTLTISIKYNQQFDTARNKPCWSILFNIVYIYTSIRLMINSYFQYKYDFSSLRYQRYKSIKQGNWTPSKQHLGSKHELNFLKYHSMDETFLFEQVEMSKQVLKSVGSPFIEAHFSVQLYAIFLIVVGWSLYINTQINFNHIANFDFSFIRAILDYENELKLFNWFVRQEIDKFIESSRNFAAISMDRRTQLFGGLSYKTTNTIRQHEANDTNDHNSQQNSITSKIFRDKPMALVEHSILIKQLERMALNGSLLPPNKMPDWINKLAYFQYMFSVCFFIYCSMVQVMTSVIFILSLDKFEPSLLDILTIFEFLMSSFVVIVCAIFYGFIILASCLDQIYSVIGLRKRIDDCAMNNKKKLIVCLMMMERFEVQNDLKLLKNIEKRNEEHVFGGRSGGVEVAPNSLDENTRNRSQLNLNHLYHTNLDDLPNIKNLNGQHQSLLIKQQVNYRRGLDIYIESCFSQMNANLLHSILDYKVFVGQFEPIKRSFGFILIIVSVLMIVMPIMGLIHVPYIDKRVKVFTVSLSMFCALAADILIAIPISYLYTRCLELYQSLSSLLAHSIEVTTHENIGRIYDRHSVWILRKELAHTDRLANQFVFRFIGLKLTYINLLKVHFWLGLVTLYMFVESSYQGELLGAVFRDPLGVY